MVFTKKGIIQKITIVLVILILFNFIVPNFISATDMITTQPKSETAIEKAGKVLFTPIRGLLVMCGDAVMNGLQYFFASNEKAVISSKDLYEMQKQDADTAVHPDGFLETIGEFLGTSTILGDIALELNGLEDVPNFKYTPQSIFEGSIKFFSINFISGKTTTSSNNTNNTNKNTNNNISETKWYKAYEMCVNNMKKDLDNAFKQNDDTKAKAIVLILSNLGVQGLQGIYDSKDVEQITCNPELAQISVKSAATKYNNGDTAQEVFGFGLANTNFNNTGKNYLFGGCTAVGVIDTYAYEMGITSSDPTMGPEINYDEMAPVNSLHDMIASWYKITRNIALIFLLSVLVYVGIRIMISSTAADTAKYKKMLIDWVVAICILFVLHYIMAFANSVLDLIISAFSTGSSNANWIDESFGAVRMKLQGNSLSDQIFYTVLYFVLVVYTVIFTVYYLKRVVYAAFLTLIAPLVSLTYPLDRMGDGKSQAFNFWLKEYIANAIVQPVHLLIYTILVSSVFSLAESNPLYAIVVMGAMLPVEKFIREMFGLNSQKGPGPAGSFAGGALTMHAFGKLMHGKPPIPQGHIDKKTGNSGEEGEKKPKVKTAKDANSSDYTDLIDEGEELVNGNKGTLFANPTLQKTADDQFKDFTGNKKEGDKEVSTSQTSEEDTPVSKDNDENMGESSILSTAQSGGESPEIPLNSQPTQKSKVSQYKDNGKLKRLKPSKQAKRMAKNARKQHYKAVNRGQWKKVGKGALAIGKGIARGAGTAIGVTAGATVAVGATIASGDISKLGTNMATGVLAGAKGGRTLSDVAIGATGFVGSGVINGVNSGLEARQDYKDTLMKEDKDYKKNQELRQQHKASKSLATQAAIRAHYGYKRGIDHKDIVEKEKQIERFMNYGVNNAETAMRAIDLMDSQGLTENQAKMAALQSERFEKDDDAKREIIRKQMTDAFLKGYVNKGVDTEQALERAMADSHAILANADRIHGVKEAEVGRQEKEYMKMKAYEEARRRTQAREAAQMNAEASAKKKLEDDAKRESKKIRNKIANPDANPDAKIIL